MKFIYNIQGTNNSFELLMSELLLFSVLKCAKLRKTCSKALHDRGQTKAFGAFEPRSCCLNKFGKRFLRHNILKSVEGTKTTSLKTAVTPSETTRCFFVVVVVVFFFHYKYYMLTNLICFYIIKSTSGNEQAVVISKSKQKDKCPLQTKSVQLISFQLAFFDKYLVTSQLYVQSHR